MRVLISWIGSADLEGGENKVNLPYRDTAAVSAIFIIFLFVSSIFVPMVKAVLPVGFFAVTLVCLIGFFVAANIAGKVL